MAVSSGVAILWRQHLSITGEPCIMHPGRAMGVQFNTAKFGEVFVGCVYGIDGGSNSLDDDNVVIF